jgi:hypothetical protein
MNKQSGRYAICGFIEGQFQPGSKGRVLLNLLGIHRKREMDRIESEELLRTFKKLIVLIDRNHRFSSADLCSISRRERTIGKNVGGTYGASSRVTTS